MSGLVHTVFSHYIFANAHKLLCADSVLKIDDDEVESTRVTAAMQYATIMKFC